jgi:hypothetical protein
MRRKLQGHNSARDGGGTNLVKAGGDSYVYLCNLKRRC